MIVMVVLWVVVVVVVVEEPMIRTYLTYSNRVRTVRYPEKITGTYIQYDT